MVVVSISPQKLLITVLIAFVLNGLRTHARICQEVNTRNNVEELETQLRGCTIVVGNVFIVLHEIYSPHYHNITFPDLREITGYLAFFRVFHLKSIGNLFPNLAVIRGDSLLSGYAFAIFDVRNLLEINLPNLRYIEKGSTRIDQCSRLCYVYTINWDKIGGPSHSIHYFNQNEGDCGLCNLQCNGYCWTGDRCQDTQPMNCDDSHCLICNQSNKSECLICKSPYFLNEGKCFAECPEKRFGNTETRTCMTAEDCSSHFGGTWWTFQGECTRKCPEGYEKVPKEQGWCRFCGDYCEKVCKDVRPVENAETANYLYKCTHIRGSLIISGNTEGLRAELEKSLSGIREIEGYLKIHRMDAYNSLDFLKNLRVIKGKELVANTYALVILDNSNLHKLWTSREISLKIENGTVYFHQNPQLCFSEIEKFLNRTGITEYSDYDISRFSNGDRKSCEHFNIPIDFKHISPKSVHVHWDRVDFTDDNDKTIAYVLHYSPDPFGNITLFSERSECTYTTWKSVSVSNHSYIINYLTPYTPYVFYIEIQTIQQMFKGHSGLFRFRTLPDIPTGVEVVQVSSTGNSILLEWNPPLISNGDLFHYEISGFEFKDKSYIHKERDYCVNPHVSVEDSEINYVGLPSLTKYFTLDDSNCCQNGNVEKEPEEFSVPQYDLPSENGSIKTSLTRLQLTSLHYFQTYILFVKACNAAGCSNTTMIQQRTKPKKDSDDVPLDIKHSVEQSNVYIHWLEPSEPNADIVSYILEYRRTDINDTISIKECVTLYDYIKNKNSYTITNLARGRYSLSIEAVSLAGSGRTSKSIEFHILVTKELSNSFSYFGYIAGVIFWLVILGLAYFYYYLVKNGKFQKHDTASVESLYELSRNDIGIDTLPESNNSEPGRIYNGFIKSQNRPCTVLSGRRCENNYELLEFLKEVLNLKVCNTYHIVQFIAVVSTVQPPLVIFELLEWGDLKSFLKKAKDSPERLSDIEMYTMAMEIADGIIFLDSKKIILHDLAARNCMVTCGQTVKIANFSMTKDVYVDDYRRKENGELIPVRWMAPESLIDNTVTHYSNIWSYGIVLWEIVTYAEQPYGDLSNEDVVNYVIGKNILAQPEGCPDLLYEMMVACWRSKPKERPSFLSLLKQLLSNNPAKSRFETISFYHGDEAKQYKKLKKIEKKESDSPNIGKKTVARWSKKGDEEEEEKLELLTEEELPSLNSPSTSRFT